MTKPRTSDPRQALFDLLEDAARDGVFPGAVAMVADRNGILYEEAHGVLATHPQVVGWQRPVQRDTIYDLASLTKIACTTTLCALAISQGLVELEDSVPEPWNAGCPGATLCDLLEHCAGLTAHRDYFLRVDGVDRAGVLEHVLRTPPEAPPRARAVYSDLGFIILGAWLERLFARPLELAFADKIAFALGLRGELEFRPFAATPPSKAPDELAVAPTEVYDASLHADGLPSHFELRRSVIAAHGVVHDDNCYAMGGVAGHAGLFGTAQAVMEIGRAWLTLGLPGLRKGVRDRFWLASGVPGSTRCVGFDAPSPDGSGSTGRALSARAVGHTGFTGTSLWIDPAAERIYVLLSNRVHPTRNNDGIRSFRPRFHEAASQL